jgi:hypothetical protein
MIIEKKAGEGDVVCFRISTGEEIVGKLISDTDTQLVIGKPVLCGLQAHPETGQPSLGFGPFMTTVANNDKAVFYKANVLVAPAAPRQDIKDAYIQATSSIVTPPKSGLIV